MKHNKNHDNVQSARPQLVPVCFEFTHPTATTVCVAGTFNRSQPEAKALHPSGGGRWQKETALTAGTVTNIVAIAFGVGALIGYLAARQCSRSND